MYLHSIKFHKSYRNFKANDYFLFNYDVTLLVGEQGCGKSTLLQLLRDNSPLVNITLTDLGKLGVDSYYFDTESMNPRIKNPEEYSNINGTSKGIGVCAALSSRFKSHGEILVDFTVNGISKAKNCVIFLDEPECSLSPTNQFRLIEEIKKAVKRKCQFIIATHCIPLIESLGVLCLDTDEYLNGAAYITRSLIKAKND